jgi:uncharacterized protein with von Willebrand factor type A (vWA) domain
VAIWPYRHGRTVRDGATHPPEAILLGFARALRAAGVHVTADREQTYLRAVATVGLEDQAATYWAGRATLCSSPTDLARYDQVYTAWFSGLRSGVKAPRSQPVVMTSDLPSDDSTGTGTDPADTEAIRAMASDTEILRHRDIAELTGGERARLAAMFAGLPTARPRRRAHRHSPAPSGGVDARRTLRAELKNLGEPSRIHWRRRGTRPRRIVILLDISGSMSSYADALLRLAHHISRGESPTEVFTLGTRVTHVTRALRNPDADRAIISAGELIPDWSGGTRLADGLGIFLSRWGRRGMARGAVVVIASDGWERGDPADLAAQLTRLRRLAHRIVWVNPHRGRAGYQPVQRGIVAALPFCDAFVAGHSLAAFAAVIDEINRRERRLSNEHRTPNRVTGRDRQEVDRA